jgi:hypothetical protein
MQGIWQESHATPVRNSKRHTQSRGFSMVGDGKQKRGSRMEAYFPGYWVDRRSAIIVCGRRAIQLGPSELVIFLALHENKRGGKKLNADALADRIYGGCKSPSSRNTVHVIVCAMNHRKLKHIGLKIEGVRREANSFYRLVHRC